MKWTLHFLLTVWVVIRRRAAWAWAVAGRVRAQVLREARALWMVRRSSRVESLEEVEGEMAHPLKRLPAAVLNAALG